MKSDDNPMRPTQRLVNAPRCIANAKTTGCRCKGPAVAGWTVCRMHGARGGAPYGQANGRWKDGSRTREADALRNEFSELVNEARDLAKALGNDYLLSRARPKPNDTD